VNKNRIVVSDTCRHITTPTGMELHLLKVQYSRWGDKSYRWRLEDRCAFGASTSVFQGQSCTIGYTTLGELVQNRL